jgi:anti-anti-sigma factor
MDGSLFHPLAGPHARYGDLPGTIALSGELDATEHQAVRAALAAALADDRLGSPDAPTEIVVDLRAVQFLDAGTIRLLVQTRQQALDTGRRLRVTGAEGPVRHVIEASGHGRQLLEPSGSTATATPAPPVEDQRSWLIARFQQRSIDAEIRATRRCLLAELRRQLPTEPRALADEAFLSVADVGTVLDGIMMAATIVGTADACHLQLTDPRTGVLHLTRHRGLPERFVAYFATVDPSRPTACATAASTGEPVIVEDVTRSRIFIGQSTLSVMSDAGIRAVHSHPLHHDDGHLIGVLSLHYLSTAPRRGDPELVAWCAARALSRATLH